MNRTIVSTGRVAALTACVAVTGYCIVQVLQLLHWIHAPVDAILIYAFSLAIAPPFLLALLAFYYTVPRERRFWAQAALLFGLLYTAYALFVYSVQLGTVIPQSSRNSHTNISVLQ